MGKMHELIIHVGMHKTGTTSIQQTLAKNSCGDEYTYLNLGAPNHSHRVYSLFSENPSGYYQNKSRSKEEVEIFNNETKELLSDCIKSLETPKAIISGEDLINLNEKELSEMHGFMKRYFERVIVFAYVREPVSYMNSLLQQVIKSGVGFEGFIDENSLGCTPFLNLRMLYPHYRRLFEKHERVFGKENVRLKLFDKSKLSGGDVVSDFIRSLNLSISVEGIITYNEGVSMAALSVIYTLRKANINGLLNIPSDVLTMIASVMHLLKGEKLVLSSEAYKELVADNFEDIFWLSRKLSEEIPVCNQKKYGIYNEKGLVSISKEDFLKFICLLENLSVKDTLKKKIVDVVETVCLHGDLNRIAERRSVEGVFADLNAKTQSRITGSDGYIEAVGKNHVSGWAKYLGSNNPVEVDIFVNDICVGATTANIYRKDLQDAFGVACAFCFRFSDDTSVKNGDTVRVRVKGDNKDVKKSPFIVSY